MIKNKIWPVLFIFLLSGCYNYRELNDLAITTAVGIDKDGNDYKMIFQVVNTQKNSSDDNSSSNPKIIIYEANGKTLQEAARKLVLASPKRIYGNHITILLISETVAKEGINDVLDLLFRDTESRKQFLILIAKGSNSKEILETLTPLETINSQKILNSVVSDSAYLGVGEDVTYEQLMEMYLNNNTEIVLPSIKLIGPAIDGEKKENLEESSPHTQIILSTMAIFKNDKLLGYTTEEESIALSYIRGELENTIVTYECPKDKGKYISVELIDVKSSMQAMKNKLQINIHVKGNGNITEIYCNVDLEKNDTIKKIEKEVENKIKDNINNSIRTINNKYNSDIYGFKDLFYKTNPNFFKTIKNNYYENYFKKIEIKTDVDITLIEKGNVTRVIKNGK